MKQFLGVTILLASVVLATGLVWADMGKTAVPLKTAPGSKAEMHNNEGIEHFTQGHWDVAKKHFMEAATSDPKSAEAHYNLALALDKAGDHKGATEHFKTAYELGKDNHDIQESGILKAHLKMK